MSASFARYPRATQIRLAAIAVLQAAGTTAGSNVLDTPLDALDPELTFPVLAVTTSTDRDTASRAGGVPTFKVTYNIHIGVGFVAAVARDATIGADMLAQAVLDALLCDPVMVKLLGQIDSVVQKSSAGKGEKRYVATSDITITSIPVTVGESYAPNAKTVLQTTGEPQAAPRTVFGPIETIINTTAPNGSTPSTPSAGLDVTLPQS